MSKRACNFKSPCGTCSLRGSSCSYSRMSSQEESKHNFQPIDELTFLETLECLTEPDVATVKPTLSMSLSLSPFTLTTIASNAIPLSYSLVSQQTSRGLCIQAFETERFEFLLNFTTYDGLDNSFNFQTSVEKGAESWHFDNFITIDDLLLIDYEASNKQAKDSEERSRTNRTMEWLFDPLLSQTKAICEKLLNLPGIDEVATGDCGKSLDEQCLEFFNPLNLRRLLDTYWKRWHRNCPIIHPPSFDPSQTPTELVLVMVLIGACVSTHPEDAKHARKWLESVERLVFALPWLSREAQSSQPDTILTRYTKLRFLQAAVLMGALQTWEGSEKAKERGRKLRFPYVAQASQELAYPQPGEQIGGDLATTLRCWDEFIFEEQLIRTKSYVFLLDTAFTIFQMTPPQITIRDLDFPFPYPDFCFHASTGGEFFESVQQICPDFLITRETRIYKAIQILCDTTNPNTYNHLPEITDLGGFILITAIHSIIFYQQISCFSSQNTVLPLFYALEKWLSLWNKRISLSQPGPEDCQLTDRDESTVYASFVRHSREYYTLALAKLEMIDKLHSVGQASHIASAGKEKVKQIITDVKRAWPSRAVTAAGTV
ncbi:hypothetical protein V8C42DRAFT_328418 [Trichoderma barbatum]